MRPTVNRDHVDRLAEDSGGFRRDPGWPPEARLWGAVMIQAWIDLGGAGGWGVRAQYQDLIRDQARAWFFSAREDAGSFLWICRELDLDAESIRAAVTDQRYLAGNWVQFMARRGGAAAHRPQPPSRRYVRRHRIPLDPIQAVGDLPSMMQAASERGVQDQDLARAVGIQNPDYVRRLRQGGVRNSRYVARIQAHLRQVLPSLAPPTVESADVRPEELAKLITRAVSDGHTLSDLARHAGVSTTCLGNIVRGRVTWTMFGPEIRRAVDRVLGAS